MVRTITLNMTTWNDQEKPGVLPPDSGWEYDEDFLEYDSDEDPETELQVEYNALGTEATWTDEIKS